MKGKRLWEPARLYLDEDVHKRAAQALRLRGFDVMAAGEIEAGGWTDDAQLAWAAAKGRALVTFNVRHCMRLHGDFVAAGQSHWGIIVSEQVRVGELVRRLQRFLNTYHRDELRNNLWWLTRAG